MCDVKWPVLIPLLRLPRQPDYTGKRVEIGPERKPILRTLQRRIRVIADGIPNPPPNVPPLLYPIRTLKAWLALRPQCGPLLVRFRKGSRHGEVRLTEERLSDKSVDNIVKHYLGVEYSAHSLRASFVTAAKLNGADDLEVMQQTKHRTSAMIQRYTRTDDIRKYNAGKKLGL